MNVLLINSHLTYPGWSEGKLNLAFMERYPKFANLWRDHGTAAPAPADSNGAG